MKSNLIKQKALFQIFLIISLSFYTSLSLAALSSPINNYNNSDKTDNENKITYFDLIKQDLLPSVNAQAPSKVCCEKTTEGSEFNGLSCVFTEQSNCDPNFQTSGVACQQTDFCKPGVCILNGVCEDNVEKKLCEEENGQWRKEKSTEVSQCQLGCCDLPSGASITTQAQCAIKIQQFPDISLENIFKPDIKDQLTCAQQSRSGEEGCCVLSDQCSFGTRKECNDLGGDFSLNTLCSAPSLGCPVTAKHSTVCYQNKVYWIDSSGNRENVYDGKFDSSWAYTNWLLVNPDEICSLDNDNLNNADSCGNCEFSFGTTCDAINNEIKNKLRNRGLKENDINKVQNQCISLDCQTTFDNPRVPWDGVPRKNGESWCSYESITGDGEDLVGARHYVSKCQNGVEVVEECSTRRKEICVQNEVPSNLYDNKNTLTYAKCVPNNWQLCLAANSEDENCGFTFDEALDEYLKLGYPRNGQQHPVGPCDVFSENEDTRDEYESCVLKTICRKDACEEQLLGQCYFNKGTGLCAPSVPPGTLGKEEEFEELTDSDIGFVFECKEIWVDEGLLGDWDCEANCDCNTKAFADSWNSYCKSLGDFGAKYSVVGELSTDGFSHRGPIGDNADGNAHKAEDLSPIPGFSRFRNANKPLTGDFYSLLSAVDQITSLHFEKLKEPDFEPAFLANLGAWSLTVATPLITVAVFSAIKSAIVGTAFTQIFGATFLATIGKVATISIFGVPGLVLAGVLFVLYGILNKLFPAEQNEVTYKVSCEPWVAPEKGRDCKKCNDKSLFSTCDEYLCQSLGKGCELLNEGSPGNETCVWINQGDTLPPIIAPLVLAPFTEQDIIKEPESTGFIGGYKFKEEISAFTSIEIGIKIIPDPNTGDDNAECKISRDPRFDYEDSDIDFFDNSLTKTNHIKKIPIVTDPILPGEDRIELEAGKVNTFYVKCKDANDNVNLKSYFIEIPVRKGPDTAPPEIKLFSIENNAFIPYNLDQTPLKIEIEDQSGIANSTTGFNGGCKYSTVDQNYDLMPFSMSCSQRRDPITLLFTCSTTLELKPNQDNVFYFRCKDLAGNINPQSMPPIENDPTNGYHLFGTKPLKITKAGPNGDVLTTDVNLTLTTAEGAEDGKSTCYYSLTKAFGANSIKFTTTDASKHETVLSLQNEKDYKFYLWCRDVAGNEDDETIEFHTTTPEYNITDASPDNVKLFIEDIQLSVTTVGGVHSNGDGTCRYEGAGSGFLQDKEILKDKTIHRKNLTLQDGIYDVTLTCSDQFKSDTKFISFEIDTQSFPQIIRLYKENNLLNIILDEAGECRYVTTAEDRSRFNYDDVTTKMVDVSSTHKQVALNSEVFYIQCKSANTQVLSPIYEIHP